MNILKIYAGLGLLITLFSCNKKLDLKPLSSFSDENVWSDPRLAELFLNHVYDTAVFTYADAGFGWGAQTDELYSNFNWVQEDIYVTGAATPDNQSATSLNYWGRLYSAIRYINIFFEKAPQLPVEGNEERIERLYGEAYFLRATAYFELLKRFGGVPLITKVYNVDDLVFDESRASWDETKEFILADLEEAMKRLPSRYPDDQNGRATLGAAGALKSRLLLYAASAGFNASNDPERWQAAKVAAKAVIDMGYALHGKAADGTYNNVFYDFFNSEVIFSRVYNGNVKEDRFNTVDRDLSPNGYNGYAAYNPIQQMVDDFEMADGSTFSWENPGQAAAPYDNREPRFYSVILANDQPFRNRSTQFYEGGDDSPGSPFAPWNASKTRYCVRKMVFENHDWDAIESRTTQWVVYRLSEIYLNYAEACAALGEDGEALVYLNKVRTEKGGLPALNASGEVLKERIRHERRIELCFEGHRYFDIRRWGIPEVGSVNARGIVINRQTDGTFRYGFQIVQERKWVNSFFYYPIPRTEIQKNPTIQQNPNY